MDEVIPTIDDLRSIFDDPTIGDKKTTSDESETGNSTVTETPEIVTFHKDVVMPQIDSPFQNPANDVSEGIKTITPELTDEEVTQRLKDAESVSVIDVTHKAEEIIPEVVNSGEKTEETISNVKESDKTVSVEQNGGSVQEDDAPYDYSQEIVLRDKFGRILKASPRLIKGKNTAGRKTVMTEVVLRHLRQAFLMGATDEEAAEFANIARSTLSDYKAKHPEYSDEIEAWKTNPKMKARATVYDTLNDARIAAWYLERKAKDEFSTRSEVTGKDGAELSPIRIEYVKPSDTIRTSKDPIRSDSETGSSMDIVNGSDNK